MKQTLPPLGVWLDRIQSWVLALLLLASLSAPVLVQLTGRSTDPSFIDNRRPAPLPAWPRSVAQVVEFRDGVTRFIGDNFGLRAELVKLNVLLHYRIGVSSVPGLVVGKDGWNFLKEDFRILDQFRGLDRFTDADLDSWIHIMEQHRRWLAARGIAFMVVIVPNQQTVYPEYMPGYANRVWPETRLDQVSRRLRERDSDLALVDLRPALWAARQQALLYHRYEGHWNAMGIFVGYSAIMQRVKRLFPGVTPLQLTDYALGTVDRSWKIPPLTEAVPTLRLKRPSSITGTEVLISINDRISVTKTSTRLESAPDVLFYGDSFGEALVPHMTETFKSTIAVSTSWAPFPIELIKRHRPQLVIYELVERYLARPLVLESELETDLLMAQAPSLATMLKDAEGPVGGYVDGARLENGQAHLSGWAVDGKTKLPAIAVYVYLGDRVIGAGTPSTQRPDVTPGMANHVAGFHIVTPPEVDARSASRPLRAFSVNPGHRVYELSIHPPLWPTIEALFNTKNPAAFEADLLLARAPSLAAMLKDTEGPVGGYVDGAALEGGKVRLSGWAVDGKARAPATAVYVYLGDRTVGAGAPSTRRPDVTAGMADQIAGFHVAIPRDVAPSTARRLRIFSVNPGRRVYEVIIHPPLWPTIDGLFDTTNPERLPPRSRR